MGSGRSSASWSRIGRRWGLALSSAISVSAWAADGVAPVRPMPEAPPVAVAMVAPTAVASSLPSAAAAPPPAATGDMSDAAARSPLSLRPLSAMRQAASSLSWRASATDSGAEKRERPRVTIVELPPEPVVMGPPPRRAHHALSISMEAPKRMLRELGLGASECATRLRLPSKLRKAQDGSTGVEVTAQIGMGCRF